MAAPAAGVLAGRHYRDDAPRLVPEPRRRVRCNAPHHPHLAAGAVYTRAVQARGKQGRPRGCPAGQR
eukprot:1193016-Prorocentrum_minimum.AAC.2